MVCMQLSPGHGAFPGHGMSLGHSVSPGHGVFLAMICLLATARWQATAGTESCHAGLAFRMPCCCAFCTHARDQPGPSVNW